MMLTPLPKSQCEAKPIASCDRPQAPPWRSMVFDCKALSEKAEHAPTNKGSFMKSQKIGGFAIKMEKGLKPWRDAMLIHCCPKSVGSHQVMVTMIYYSPEIAVITALRNSFQSLSVSVSMLFLSFGKSYTPSMIGIQDSIVIPESLVRRICLKASKTHTIHLSRCYSIRPLVAHHNSPRHIRCLELHGRLQNHRSSKSFQNLKSSLV